MKNQKSGFIVPLLIVITALLAIAGGAYYYQTTRNEITTTQPETNSTTTVVADWKTYANLNYGFSVTYPPTWTLTDISYSDSQKHGMINLESPIRYDIAGYEKSGANYLLQVSFLNGPTIIQNSFIKSNTSELEKDRSIPLNERLKNTDEYRDSQKIITTLGAVVGPESQVGYALPSATIDQNVLTTTSAFPTITGSASNVASLSIEFGGYLPAKGLTVSFHAATVQVVNGKWSFTPSKDNTMFSGTQGLPPGSYPITVNVAQSASPLATGILVVKKAQTSVTPLW